MEEIQYEFKKGTCEIVDTPNINQQKCLILKRIVLNYVNKQEKQYVDSLDFFDYEFGLDKNTQMISQIVIFNGYTNTLEYFDFNPIPVELVCGDYTTIEEFLEQIEPYIDFYTIE
jgi:hypothetical protein